MLKQKKRSFSYTDPYGMQEGCPASIACAGTHSFCLDEWLDTVQSVLQLPNKTPGFQNGGKHIDVGMISLYLSQ